MQIPRILSMAFVAALAAHLPTAGAFQQSFDGPPFTVSVPRLPAIALTPQAGTDEGRRRVFRGQDASYVVEVESRQSPAAVSPRNCAGAFLLELVKRPGVPDRDNIYRAPFDADTFLVLYLALDGGAKSLHAHLLSATAGTHCIDAHFTRAWKAGEELDDWRTTFQGAAVQAAQAVQGGAK